MIRCCIHKTFDCGGCCDPDCPSRKAEAEKPARIAHAIVAEMADALGIPWPPLPEKKER